MVMLSIWRFAPKQGAYGGNTDFLDTGANGNYGGPCPPSGDTPHRYIFTLYALDVPQLAAAAGLPKTRTAGLRDFGLGIAGVVAHMLAKATFTATCGR
jgi:phosphatidylethanolamine-binding protein (PEBP) family uncharacterized protein